MSDLIAVVDTQPKLFDVFLDRTFGADLLRRIYLDWVGFRWELQYSPNAIKSLLRYKVSFLAVLLDLPVEEVKIRYKLLGAVLLFNREIDGADAFNHVKAVFGIPRTYDYLKDGSVESIREWGSLEDQVVVLDCRVRLHEFD